MITYGLKLWTKNQDLFDETLKRFNRKEFDFVELYHYPHEVLDFDKLSSLKGIPITIHQPNDSGFHELIVDEKLLEIWKDTVKLADFFDSKYIILHTGQKHTVESSLENLAKIDDRRIIIENSPGLDMSGYTMFGQNIDDLEKIKNKSGKDICLDFQKASSASHRQNLHYRDFVEIFLQKLTPTYFHISGWVRKDVSDTIGIHGNLFDDTDTDWRWTKEVLTHYAKDNDAPLVFETPYIEGTLENYIRNIEFFNNL